MPRRSRVACVRVPDLPLAAEQRAHPELRGRPLAIAAGAGPSAELLSVSPEAARRGACRGLSVAHARSVCPALRVRVASPALEQAAREALLDVAFACSPRAALAPRAGGAFASEAIAFACAAGVDAAFRSERGFAGALGRKAHRLGLAAHVAVASSRALARIAARLLGDDLGDDGRGRVVILSPEREAGFLAPLPLDLFDPDDDLADALTRFGAHTVRDLLALPRRALGTRLGPRALELARRARGGAPETPLPEARDRRFAEGVDLETPIDRLEPLLFVLRGALARLLERLEARHLACGDLELRLELDGGGWDARRIGVAAPTADLRGLLRLVRHSLESRAPGKPVESVRLEAQGLPLRGSQLDLFRPAGPAPAALGETLATLQGLCGEGRVGAPATADAHHPDAYTLSPFAPSRPSDPRASPEPSFTGALALRALRPPVPAQVRVERQSPVWVCSPVAKGHVLRCAGPWRTTGSWWSPEERFAFDSFDVQTRDGTVARLRFDHVRREWQIDAVYD